MFPNRQPKCAETRAAFVVKRPVKRRQFRDLPTTEQDDMRQCRQDKHWAVPTQKPNISVVPSQPPAVELFVRAVIERAARQVAS